MRNRDKFLLFWLLIAGVASIAGMLLDDKLLGNNPINIFAGVFVNVAAWCVVIRIVFWVYDRITKRSVREADKL